MRIGLEPAAAERVDDLVGALDRMTAALNANTEARWASNPVKPPKPEPCGGDCKAGER